MPPGPPPPPLLAIIGEHVSQTAKKSKGGKVGRNNGCFFIFWGGGGGWSQFQRKQNRRFHSNSCSLVKFLQWVFKEFLYRLCIFFYKTFSFKYFHACVSHEIVTGIKENRFRKCYHSHMHAAAGEVHT
jgi:hypothetical protein